MNEKIGDLEDVQGRVTDAEDELAELEPKGNKPRRKSMMLAGRSMRCLR